MLSGAEQLHHLKRQLSKKHQHLWSEFKGIMHLMSADFINIIIDFFHLGCCSSCWQKT